MHVPAANILVVGRILIGIRVLKNIISTGIPGVIEKIIPAMSIVSMKRAMVTMSTEHPTILMRSWCIQP